MPTWNSGVLGVRGRRRLRDEPLVRDHRLVVGLGGLVRRAEAEHHLVGEPRLGVALEIFLQRSHRLRERAEVVVRTAERVENRLELVGQRAFVSEALHERAEGLGGGGVVAGIEAVEALAVQLVRGVLLRDRRARGCRREHHRQQPGAGRVSRHDTQKVRRHLTEVETRRQIKTTG